MHILFLFCALFLSPCFAGMYNPPVSELSSLDSSKANRSELTALQTTADGLTLKKSGSTFSVQNWIVNNLIQGRFEMWNNWQTQSRGLLDGPGYWFSDQNGIITNQSSGYTYSSGYGNSLVENNYAIYRPGVGGDVGSSEAGANLPTGSVSRTITYWFNMSYTGTGLTGALPLWGYGKVGVAAATVFIWCGESRTKIHVYTQGGNDQDFLMPEGASSSTNFHFFSAVYDAGNVTVYYDGTNLGTKAISLNTQLQHVGAGMMYWGAGRYLQPYTAIDEVTVYTTNLAAASIVELYNKGKRVTQNNNPFGAYIAYLCHYDEGSGTDIVPEIGEAGTTTASWLTLSVSNTLYASTTLTVTNTTLSFVPASTYASSIINVGSGTIAASNVILAASRDGGTTWSTAPVTITDSWDISNKLVSASISMTNQPVGSNVFPRIYLTNGCPMVTVKGMAFPCGE